MMKGRGKKRKKENYPGAPRAWGDSCNTWQPQGKKKKRTKSNSVAARCCAFVLLYLRSGRRAPAPQGADKPIHMGEHPLGKSETPRVPFPVATPTRGKKKKDLTALQPAPPLPSTPSKCNFGSREELFPPPPPPRFPRAPVFFLPSPRDSEGEEGVQGRRGRPGAPDATPPTIPRPEPRRTHPHTT